MDDDREFGFDTEREIECPFCGEPSGLEVDVDPSEPGEHVFVQDCEVCCNPWTVRVNVGHRGELTIDVDRG